MLLQMVILVLSLSNVQSLSCVKGRGDSFQYCEPSKQDKNVCRCNNIQINGTGYSDCKSIYDGTPWCYVTESSPCRDKRYSAQNVNGQSQLHLVMQLQTFTFLIKLVNRKLTFYLKNCQLFYLELNCEAKKKKLGLMHQVQNYVKLNVTPENLVVMLGLLFKVQLKRTETMTKIVI